MSSDATKSGATGEYPAGKLNDDDEGELRIGICHDKGTLVINFGKKIYWLGLSPKEARELAALINKHADLIEAEASGG